MTRTAIAAAAIAAASFIAAPVMAQGYPTFDNQAMLKAIQLLSSHSRQLGVTTDISGTLGILTGNIGAPIPGFINTAMHLGRAQSLLWYTPTFRSPLLASIPVNWTTEDASRQSVERLYYTTNMQPTQTEVVQIKQRRQVGLAEAADNCLIIAQQHRAAMAAFKDEIESFASRANAPTVAAQQQISTDIQLSSWRLQLAQANMIACQTQLQSMTNIAGDGQMTAPSVVNQQLSGAQ